MPDSHPHNHPHHYCHPSHVSDREVKCQTVFLTIILTSVTLAMFGSSFKYLLFLLWVGLVYFVGIGIFTSGFLLRRQVMGQCHNRLFSVSLRGCQEYEGETPFPSLV